MSKVYGTAIQNRKGKLLDVEMEDSREVATALAQSYSNDQGYSMVVVEIKVVG